VSPTGANAVWAPGADYLYGLGGADHLYGGNGIDPLYGGLGADALFGGNDADIVLGGLESDLIDGGAGNDELFGEDGNDDIWGGLGNDWLYGGAGDDLLRGGPGEDWLYGSAGRDTYVLDTADGTIDFIFTFEDHGPDADRLDIRSLLTGFDASDPINQFVRLTTYGTDSLLSINSDGVGGDYVPVARFSHTLLTGPLESYLAANVLVALPDQVI
jgi:Ca2+-binding RTX toxin-like protein